jgi:hypothetical protein
MYRDLNGAGREMSERLRLCEVETYPKGASATTTFQPQSRRVPIASIRSNQGACFKLVRLRCAWVVRVSVRLDKASQLSEGWRWRGRLMRGPRARRAWNWADIAKQRCVVTGE